jgi:hypothetical protein
MGNWGQISEKEQLFFLFCCCVVLGFRVLRNEPTHTRAKLLAPSLNNNYYYSHTTLISKHSN